jgi:hypothetical protein
MPDGTDAFATETQSAVEPVAEIAPEDMNDSNDTWRDPEFWTLIEQAASVDRGDTIPDAQKAAIPVAPEETDGAIGEDLYPGLAFELNREAESVTIVAPVVPSTAVEAPSARPASEQASIERTDSASTRAAVNAAATEPPTAVAEAKSEAASEAATAGTSGTPAAAPTSETAAVSNEEAGVGSAAGTTTVETNPAGALVPAPETAGTDAGAVIAESDVWIPSPDAAPLPVSAVVIAPRARLAAAFRLTGQAFQAWAAVLDAPAVASTQN